MARMRAWVRLVLGMLVLSKDSHLRTSSPAEPAVVTPGDMQTYSQQLEHDVCCTPGMLAWALPVMWGTPSALVNDCMRFASSI
jgi:hypothetical protein